MPTPSTSSSDLTAAEARAIFEAWYFEWRELVEIGHKWNVYTAYYESSLTNKTLTLKDISRGAGNDEMVISFVLEAMRTRVLGD